MATTTVEHPNATLFRRGYEAFTNGDLDAVRSLFAEDVVWHTGGRNRFSGDRRGVDDTLALFMELIDATNGTLRFDVHDVVANDDHAVALVKVRWEFDGKEFEDLAAHSVHMRDGKTTESWFFDWTPYLFDEQFPA